MVINVILFSGNMKWRQICLVPWTGRTWVMGNGWNDVLAISVLPRCGGGGVMSSLGILHLATTG